MKRYLEKNIQGYLHTNGRKMVNEAGDEVILCGWGAGNWMNPEGYMVTGLNGMYGFTPLENKFQNNIRFDRGRTMDAAIRELCGSDYADRFWPRWYRNYLGEEDIKAMAEAGYNSIRLPLDSRGFLYEEPGIHWNEDSFQMLDQVVDWCEKYDLYAILDLHAAPGGQSGVSCDNGIDNIPHLFMEPESWERTLILWEELAKRYKNRYAVGGYELLNEPISLPHWRYLSPKLRAFYEDAIERIRKYDKRHMIILQGPAFAHDMEFFDQPFDMECQNWCYSVHLHGFIPEPRTIYEYIEPSIRLNVPLWIGEGSGSKEAMAVFCEMMAHYHIGYNLFSWKFMAKDDMGRDGLVWYEKPEGWNQIMDYISKGGPRPNYNESQRIFDDLLEMCKYEHCKKDESVHIYALRKQGVSIPAVGYDLPENESRIQGNWHYGNVFGYRTEDHIKMPLRPGGRRPYLFDGMREKPDPLAELLLELSQGMRVSYSVYHIDHKCSVKCRAFVKTNTFLKIAWGNEHDQIILEQKDELQEFKLTEITESNCQKVSIQCIYGCVWMEKIIFSE